MKDHTMSKRHNFISAVLAMGLMLGLMGGVLSGARADGQHPHYLRALSDLRYARAWLLAPEPKWQHNDVLRSISQIDLAIAEIKRAAIDDGKNTSDHPAVDANLKGMDRMRKVVALLLNVRIDLTNEHEDDKKALGWRRAALKHTEDALNTCRHLMR